MSLKFLDNISGKSSLTLLLSSCLFMSAASAATQSSVNTGRANCGSLANQANTEITYFQVPMQKQWIKNQKAISDKEYAKYFSQTLVAPKSMVKALENGPLPKKWVIEPTVEGLNKVIETFDKAPVAGYALIENGPLAYAQSRHVFPGLTSSMLEWWFTWHPIESERYMLWFPQAHIHNSVADPQRLSNKNLSYAERLYKNPNHIIEYIGANYLDSYIHFDTPESLGIDGAALKKAGFTFSASGIIAPAGDEDAPFVLMVHLGRDTPQGLELINRYWIGTHASFDRFPSFPNGAKRSAEVVKKFGLDAKSLEEFAHEMAVHDMTEFTCLGNILPNMYKEYGKGK
ncbi:hypothetical protein MMO38_10450 [Acinetobacter sp. NIPH 1852]|uniref:DAPG hydrolase family protein n=1 Tax=Acinetobacter sp. NIPH 1852 TaxID=2923428 RepID=UPI001F4A22B7|nr:hypothetical protein [Acinetobacter sp. NIPH 1852]MCH7308550.1 hypothetical protein [Acinetobacter sp. NIPH 1852]